LQGWKKAEKPQIFEEIFRFLVFQLFKGFSAQDQKKNTKLSEDSYLTCCEL